MRVNADFQTRVVFETQRAAWISSPETGVDRIMLDRIGGEVARATSLVRYAPGSKFAPHRHDGGEEFLVLAGVFQDEYGDYPTGTYVRNPIGTEHSPRSDIGCIILVKLRQFHLDDTQPVIRKSCFTRGEQKLYPSEFYDLRLHQFSSNDYHENVRIIHLDNDQEFILDAKDGAEIFVLSGSLSDKQKTYTERTWIREPVDTTRYIKAGENGCALFIKSGHLRNPIGIPT